MLGLGLGLGKFRKLLASRRPSATPELFWLLFTAFYSFRFFHFLVWPLSSRFNGETDRSCTIHFKPHRTQSTRQRPIVTDVAWLVCLYVCWTLLWALPKRMNRSSAVWDVDFGDPRNDVLGGALILLRKGAFWGTYLSFPHLQAIDVLKILNFIR